MTVLAQETRIGEPTNGMRVSQISRRTLRPEPCPVTELLPDVEYLSLHQRERIPQRMRTRTKIDHAVHLISEAQDTDKTPVERSNLFDEWKQTLDLISEQSHQTSIAFRQVLGLLVSAVHKKDVSDYASHLPILATVTSILGRASVTESDAQEALGALRKCASLTLPLAAQEEYVDRYDSRIEEILSED